MDGYGYTQEMILNAQRRVAELETQATNPKGNGKWEKKWSRVNFSPAISGNEIQRGLAIAEVIEEEFGHNMLMEKIWGTEDLCQ